ncbi:hypothetical protein [Halodesulfovibrio aestuarii]|uniref:hypothetical protein n=1 Tax=Halodesulfovibrio aestuarii TaxID=126333 RepID=UPI003D3595F2
MANPVPAEEITIIALHEAIERALREAFPQVKVCGYDDLTQKVGSRRTKLKLPAFVLSLPSFENKAPTATEQLAATLRWELRVVCSKNGERPELEVRELSRIVSTFIDGNRFDLNVKGAQFIAAGEDQFSPELIDYVPWLVEFEQSVSFGTSCFIDDFITPDEVYVSMAPDIGLDHKNKYELVTEEVIDELPDSGTATAV